MSKVIKVSPKAQNILDCLSAFSIPHYWGKPERQTDPGMSFDSAIYWLCDYASLPLLHGDYIYVYFICSFIQLMFSVSFHILGAVYDVRNAAMNTSNKRQNFFFRGSYILIEELDNKYIKSIYNMQKIYIYITCK